MRFIPIAALLLAATPALAAEVDDRTAVTIAKPRELIVDRSLSPATVAAMLKLVEAFYGFWNNGSQALLDQAISPTFTDRALPPGRPQGPKGPMVAARAFLAAVPDLRCVVEQRLVVGDRVVSHLRFTGHFTGTFQGVKGRGHPSRSRQEQVRSDDARNAHPETPTPPRSDSSASTRTKLQSRGRPSSRPSGAFRLAGQGTRAVCKPSRR